MAEAAEDQCRICKVKGDRDGICKVKAGWNRVGQSEMDRATRAKKHLDRAAQMAKVDVDKKTEARQKRPRRIGSSAHEGSHASREIHHGRLTRVAFRAAFVYPSL